MKNIRVTGARLHNLKNIDVSIPKNKLIAVTGVSGSGKSSLVFDIIFEEGRRQYLQSLGIFTGFDDENKFDNISGISPAIAVQQSIIRQSTPRSTVGSKTNILNLLAVLYAREGRILCSSCKIPVDNNLTCKKCGYTEERLEANYFSYNSANGMCMKCSGRGAYFEINMDKLVPDTGTTLQQIFETVGVTPGYMRILNNQFSDFMDKPFSQINDEVKEEIIYGRYINKNSQKRSYCLTRIFEGILYKYGEDPNGIYKMTLCSNCQGFRIGEEARNVLLNGRHIGEIGKMTIEEVHIFLEELMKAKSITQFGKNLLKELISKTHHLIKIRLGHLTLYREMPTLSGGEVQRIFLNSHLNSEMDSLIYILDEPTIGLHESEKGELLESIKNLKDIGNTVIVVEHDRKTIEMAEHIIDIGPRAGINGGQVIYQGDLEGLLHSNESITGRYLSGKNAMPHRSVNLKSVQNKTKLFLTIRNAKTHNLKNVTVSFPLGSLIGIAGLSGSGKSSLISHTLIPLLKIHFQTDVNKNRNNNEETESDNNAEATLIETVAEKLDGVENISGYAEVTQAPIGRKMNSTPVSYIGIWDKIRKLFAAQPKAIENNLSDGHFSFNSKGSCSSCNGSGRETIWLSGNLKIFNTCKECHGKKYNDEALSIAYKNKNIFDILEMSISEAVIFFKDNSGILSALHVMERIGMGYIKLGQPTPTLSGGEAQRIKLAKEIGRRRKGNILYIMDEPTSGLSLYDTAKLMQLLDELVLKGNSVIVIEHDTVVLSYCDWIIELGPGSGAKGGSVIAEGLPEDINKNSKSITGKYLNPKTAM